jgi:hypothetical protein
MLKGQCHVIFCFRFFARIIFPQAPENNTRVIFDFFPKFAEIFTSQGAPPVLTPPVANVTTSSAGVVDIGGKISPVSMTLATINNIRRLSANNSKPRCPHVFVI